MAIKSGSLGGGTLAKDIEVVAYECKAPAIAAGVTISICSKTTALPKVRISIGAGADSAAVGSVFLEHGAPIVYGTPLERGGIAVSVGKKIFISSDTADVDYAVYGFEKEAAV